QCTVSKVADQIEQQEVEKDLRLQFAQIKPQFIDNIGIPRNEEDVADDHEDEEGQLHQSKQADADQFASHLFDWRDGRNQYLHHPGALFGSDFGSDHLTVQNDGHVQEEDHGIDEQICHHHFFHGLAFPSGMQFNLFTRKRDRSG